MDRLDDLIARAETYAETAGLSLSTVSRKLFNDGKGLTRLKSGGQCTVKTLDAAFGRLADLEAGARGGASLAGDATSALSAAGGAPTGVPNGAPGAMSHLDRLEAEAIHIMRQVAAEAENPVMLYSIGKDSTVMLHLARKAFHPGRPPFPLMHIDTTWNFRETIDFRDAVVKEFGFELIVHVNEDGVSQGITPFTHGSQIYTDVMLTQSLRQGLETHGFDAAFGGRRDEEKSRAKERILSFRSEGQRWDPKNQRPELWSIYNTRVGKGQSIRAFPISNWTELDIWQYIHRENIRLPNVYFAAERPVVERDGVIIMVDDDRLPLADGERPRMETVRFRTLGCYPLTGGVKSTAADVPAIIQETLLATASERHGRVIDHDQSASMEKKKQEGYF